jgi:hypothetical protein
VTKRASSVFSPTAAKSTVTFISSPLPLTARTTPSPNFACRTIDPSSKPVRAVAPKRSRPLTS